MPVLGFKSHIFIVLSNLASLIIIGSKFVLGSPVLLLEGTGAAIGMTGALICAYAGSEASGEEGHDSSLAMLGNILAFLASVATALYLTVAKTLRPRVDLFVFMLFIFTYAAMSVLLYMVWAGQPYELSTDATIGLFGWLRLEPDRLPLELWMAIICNLLGTTGYIAIMKYFDPVVVSMVMLMEPIVASLMGAAAGVSTLPGLMTWAGDGVVVVGSILVILSGSKKTETIDATKALHTVNEELIVEGKPGLLRRSSMSTKTPTLKRSVVLRSPTRHMIRKDRANTGDESMEFVFVGNKSRGDTAISSLRDSRHKVAWN
jgi:drug/metabolite transporter (DMT)-like permease